MPFVEGLVRHRPGHQLGDLGERVGPRTVYGPGRRFDRRVSLRPADLGASLQPKVLELGRGQTGLDLEVATAWPAQPLLPVPAAGGRAPEKQLAAAQLSGRGLDEPSAVGLHRGDPRPSLGRDLEEVIRGSLRRQRIADVGGRVVGEGDVDTRDGSVVSGPPGSSGGGQDPHARFLGGGDVRPPVERFGLRVGIADTDESEQQPTVGRHQQVDREDEISGAFPLPDPHCGATAGRHAAREHGSARRGRVAGGAEVPLHAAGEPGVGEPEVGELQTPVGEHQIPVSLQVAQRPQPASELRKHERLQRVVGQLDRGYLLRPQVAAVVVLQRVRQRIGQPAVRDALAHVGRQVGRGRGVRKPLQAGEGRERRFRADIGGGQPQRGLAHHSRRHASRP